MSEPEKVQRRVNFKAFALLGAILIVAGVVVWNIYADASQSPVDRALASTASSPVDEAASKPNSQTASSSNSQTASSANPTPWDQAVTDDAVNKNPLEMPNTELTGPAERPSPPPVAEDQIEGVWYPTDEAPIETYAFVEDIAQDGQVTVTLADKRILVLKPLQLRALTTGSTYPWSDSGMSEHRWHRVTIGHIFDVTQIVPKWGFLYTQKDRTEQISLAVNAVCAKGGHCETNEEAYAEWQRRDSIRQREDADRWRAGNPRTNQ